MICIKSKRFMLFIISVFIFTSVSCLVLSAAMKFFSHVHYNYFFNFQSNCEMFLKKSNFSALNSSPFLEKHILDLKVITELSVLMICAEILNVFFLSYLFNITKDSYLKELDNRAVFQLK